MESIIVVHLHQPYILLSYPTEIWPKLTFKPLLHKTLFYLHPMLLYIDSYSILHLNSSASFCSSISNLLYFYLFSLFKLGS